MEPNSEQKQIETSRAKEIDTGAFPLQLSNVLLGLPYKPGSDLDESSASTRPWSWNELVSQKKLIANINITSATKQDEPIWEFWNSWNNLIENSHFKGNLGQLFTCKSWDLNFKFEFRSSFQQVGMSLINYSNCPRPLEGYFYQGKAIHAFVTQTQLPHRMIQMGEDVDLDITLKWNAPWKTAFDSRFYSTSLNDYLVDDYWMGVLRLYVPFKMHVATGVDANMTVRIWSYLTNVKSGGYLPRDDIL